MDPVAFQLGPLTVRWYGIMMALTILTAIWFAGQMGPRFGVPRAALDRISFWLVIVLFVGARLGYVVTNPAEFRDPLEILRVWHGGLGSHGAMAAGLLFAYLAARRLGISFWSLLDTAAWSLPLGHIFNRFGNFMNGELYGDPTRLPWGVRFPTAPGAPRHPLQLYEMGFGLIILLIGLAVARRRAFPGQVWWVIVVLTSIGRIFLDSLRSEEHVLWGAVAFGQIAAALLLVIGVWFLWRKPTAAHAGA